ncbi:hypothetical protein E2C01_036281 [Portunus trituberculatus]|uniref:Uncharacterized protein n=1 Tax=Portunus trituberculatus TaxID=210409 RepID=A0A5B7FDT4_PORTR|nr:hypothetical protein [Portunus trituberculatus]
MKAAEQVKSEGKHSPPSVPPLTAALGRLLTHSLPVMLRLAARCCAKVSAKTETLNSHDMHSCTVRCVDTPPPVLPEQRNVTHNTHYTMYTNKRHQDSRTATTSTAQRHYRHSHGRTDAQPQDTSTGDGRTTSTQ